MPTAEATRPSGTADPEAFLIAKEPRLGWNALNPLARRWPLPAPLGVKPTFHLFWARNALYHGLRLLGLGPGDRVLVPAFHCSSLVEPILSCGASVDFYNIQRDCSPDFGDLETQIVGTTRAILVIHYFGFPGPIQRFRDLCDERGLALIEDCAHVLAGAGDGTL